MTKENMKNVHSNSKPKKRSMLPKIVIIFMLIATIALYVSTIVYQVAAN